MAEFCKCGSLIFNEKCTNKSCDFKSITESSSSKNKKSPSSKNTEKSKSSTSKSRKSSRCVTYKLSEFLEKEGKTEDDL